MTPDRAIETAADYADALMTARRAKHLLILLLVLMLLAQLVLFFVARYTTVLDPLAPPATQPTLAADLGAVAPPPLPPWVPPPGVSETRPVHRMLHYTVGGIAFLGVVLAIVLSFVLLLIVNVMLVGRLIGVSRLTSAYIWSLVIVLFLFPWQAFLNNQYFTADWKFPGVLYTWPELVLQARFITDNIYFATVKWARFVGFPIIAILILLTIQIKSSRGLRQALGEDQVTAADTLPGV